jgi:hypothetical protein
MNKEFDNIILISGAARSGTSLVAGIINNCGVFGGKMSSGNKNNPKGMFENARIRNQIVKPYLRDLGLDVLGQYPLPDINKIPIPNDWRKRIENVFREEGYKEGQRVFYKGAKCCLLWPIYHHAFPNAKWVIVRRRTGDISDSCVKTNFMRAFTREQFRQAIGVTNERDGWVWWVRQHEKRFVEMINEGLNCKIIWPDRMVGGDYSQLYDTLEWLGLEWNVSKILNFIDPKLWHSRKSHPYVGERPPKKDREKPVSVKKYKPDSKLFNPIRLPMGNK